MVSKLLNFFSSSLASNNLKCVSCNTSQASLIFGSTRTLRCSTLFDSGLTYKYQTKPLPKLSTLDCPTNLVISWPYLQILDKVQNLAKNQIIFSSICDKEKRFASQKCLRLMERIFMTAFQTLVLIHTISNKLFDKHC